MIMQLIIGPILYGQEIFLMNIIQPEVSILGMKLQTLKIHYMSVMAIQGMSV